jgi:murein DD-endopeptidase MepM/ murein hydrolase activator NlpD
MRHAREAAVGALVAMVVCSAVLAAASSASASGTGDAQALSESQTGGSEYGVPGHVALAPRPVLSDLRVPTSTTAGPPPKVTLRLQEQGVSTVYLQVKVINLATHHSSLVATMGWSPTGRTLTVSWPRGATLRQGAYHVSVSARDHRGATLLRTAHSSGTVSLTVKAPASPPVKAPPPAVSAPAPPTEAGVPTVAQTVADGAIFPVAGEHNFGGPENVFGAARDGYSHQGQDILTTEGTPVVVPLAGTITSTSYQAGGAGYYAVEETGIGFDFMFAHCEASSLVVGTGQAISAGQALCKAGQTGDATAPHLDFEIWVGGWQVATGHPINPLPYLEAWEHDGAGA